MSKYAGLWKFHSIGQFDDNGKVVYLNAEEYLKSPMPYIDESDEDEVAHELKERKMTVGGKIKICDDGKLYMLAPLPEGVSQAEVDKAVAAGMIQLMDGMMLGDKALTWEERDGELWYDTGIEGEVMGEKKDGWVKALDADGFFTFMTTRYVKE